MTDDHRVGFLLTTKDRPEFTRRCLQSVDTCGGFDLIWVDGSTTPEGKALPHIIQLRNSRIVELYQDVRPTHIDRRSKSFGGNLGSHTAIHFGLKRVIELGYDYCGIIENDMVFQPGWFPKLMELFELGKKDGFEVGAVTARSMTTRVLAYRPQHLIMWNIGAGMVLFTRESARIVLETYAMEYSAKLARFFRRKFGADLSNVWELWFDRPNRELSPDWGFSKCLYKRGLISLGTIPSLVSHLDLDIEAMFRSSYVTGNPGKSEEDDQAYSRFKSALASFSRTPGLKERLSFTLDSAKAMVFRAQLRSKGIRDIIYYSGRAAHPVSAARSVYRKIRNRINGANP